MKLIKKTGFTLVELIVVITILAILGTIAFISLQGYSAQARDSKRLSDVSNIKKSLELFSLNTGKYPLADDYFTVSYSGEKVRHQGTVGEQVTTNLSRNLNTKPTDPLTGQEYVFSTTHSQTEYEVLSIYESDLIGMDTFKSPFVALAKKGIGIFSSTNAANANYTKIDGNYNGIYVKTSNYYVPTPSIINGNLFENFDFYNDDSFLTSQLITGGDNIPQVSTGLLDIKLSVYEGGIISENSTNEEKEALVGAIQTAYSGTQLANETMYTDILSITTTEEMVDFVDIVVLNNISVYNTQAEDIGSSSWSSVDSNCNIDTDVVVSGTDLSGNPLTQIWAPCNTTFGSGIIYNAGNKCYDYEGVNIGGEACYGYNTNEYNYNSTYGVDNIWGKLYAWYRAGASDGINLDNDNNGIIDSNEDDEVCPGGRHIPTQEEWVILLKNLGCSDYGGPTLHGDFCAGFGWAENLSYNPDRILIESLNIPLAGINTGGIYNRRGGWAYYWSSTEYETIDTSARGIFLSWAKDNVHLNGFQKYRGYSVRCIKD